MHRCLSSRRRRPQRSLGQTGGPGKTNHPLLSRGQIARCDGVDIPARVDPEQILGCRTSWIVEILRSHNSLCQDPISHHSVFFGGKPMSFRQRKRVLSRAPDMERDIDYLAVKSVSSVTDLHTSASSVAVRSRSSSDTISFGECMYRFGTETSAVATPSPAI